MTWAGASRRRAWHGWPLSGRLEIWHIYGASLLFGLADAFFQPAYLALVPELTPVSALTSANSLTSLSSQAGRIMGPALGAALVGLGGTTLAFAGNALSFFAAALLVLPLLRLSTAPAPRLSQGMGGIGRDLREGLAVVAGSPILWVTILLFSLTNITLAAPFAVALPFLVKDHLHGDVRTLGLLYAVFSIGYVLGGLWMGRYPRLRWRGLVSYGGAIVAGWGWPALGAKRAAGCHLAGGPHQRRGVGGLWPDLDEHPANCGAGRQAGPCGEL
ncbi:MAG: MFS transporter [Anaerolineae bacterium]|nr:MFS transporter [Anaerolineae bacterium]